MGAALLSSSRFFSCAREADLHPGSLLIVAISSVTKVDRMAIVLKSANSLQVLFGITVGMILTLIAVGTVTSSVQWSA